MYVPQRNVYRYTTGSTKVIRVLHSTVKSEKAANLIWNRGIYKTVVE